MLVFMLDLKVKNKKRRGNKRCSVLVKACGKNLIVKRSWFNGRMHASHACDPGPIPGGRILFLKKFFVRRMKELFHKNGCFLGNKGGHVLSGMSGVSKITRTIFAIVLYGNDLVTLLACD